MSTALLAALLEHARAVVRTARTTAERTRLARQNAEYVLRNRAKLLAARLRQTNDAAKRRAILRRELSLS